MIEMTDVIRKEKVAPVKRWDIVQISQAGGRKRHLQVCVLQTQVETQPGKTPPAIFHPGLRNRSYGDDGGPLKRW